MGDRSRLAPSTRLRTSDRMHTVQRNLAATLKRRASLEREYRQRLLNELGPDDGSVTKHMLMECAVISFIELMEIKSMYLRAKANAAAMVRLTAVRNALNRSLALLGVGDLKTEDEPTIGDLVDAARAGRTSS